MARLEKLPQIPGGHEGEQTSEPQVKQLALQIEGQKVVDGGLETRIGRDEERAEDEDQRDSCQNTKTGRREVRRMVGARDVDQGTS